MRGFGLRRRKTTVGVDIGSGFSKAAVIDHGENGPRLTGLATAPNEADTVRGGTIRDPERVADTLSALFRRERIKPRNVAIGIGGRDVLSKVIEIDRMDDAEARAVMPWEAEQHVPFDMKNTELDFAIIDPHGEGSTMTVLLAAAKRDVIEARIALLRRADLNPTTVDVEALALRNALEANYPTAMKDVTVLADIGAHSTAIHLLRNGLPAADPRTGRRRPGRRRIGGVQPPDRARHRPDGGAGRNGARDRTRLPVRGRGHGVRTGRGPRGINGCGNAPRECVRTDRRRARCCGPDRPGLNGANAHALGRTGSSVPGPGRLNVEAPVRS